MKVLIIEDNQMLSNNISKFLNLEKIKTDQAFTWKDGYYEVIKNDYDVIILDLNLPDIDGTKICKKLRDNGISIPIIMLTARTTTKDKINWLDIWADDYLTKPFDYNELLARLKSLVRRNYNVKSKKIKVKNIEMDIDNKTVQKDSKLVKLTWLEFNLLLFFCQNKWKVFSKEKLLEKVWWEFDALMFSRTVDIYIWYLRKKLWKDLIITKRWLWYMIE